MSGAAQRLPALAHGGVAAVIGILGGLIGLGGAEFRLPYLVGVAGSGFVPEGTPWRIAAGFLFGLGIGFISSLLGVAGGEVIIPTLGWEPIQIIDNRC